MVKLINGSKHNTLYSHDRATPIRYDGKLLLLGGNNLKSSCESLNIETLASYQSNVSLKGLESGEIMSTIIQNQISQGISEVYTSPKFENMYIFGIDGTKEIWKVNLRDMSWKSVPVPKNLQFWDYSIAISLPDGRIVLNGGINGNLKVIKRSCFIITPREVYKTLKYDYIKEYKLANPSKYPDVVEESGKENEIERPELDVFVCESMLEERYTHTSTYLNGYVYAIGGRHFGSGEEGVMT